MGNEILLKTTQNEYLYRFYKRFSVIQRDPLNSVMYVEEKRTGCEYMLRELTTNDYIQKRKIEHLVKYKQQHKSKYLIRLEDYLFEKDKSYCSNLFRAYLLFYTKFKDLRDYMIYRRVTKHHFEDYEIFNVLHSSVMGVKYLRYIGQPHYAISSTNILINKEGFILLSDPWLNPNSPNHNMHVYNSPYKIRSMSNPMGESYDLFYSDLYSIGMVILEIYHLYFMDDVYIKNGRLINRYLLYRRLNAITNVDLRRFTSLLLEPLPYKRWNVVEEVDVILRLQYNPRAHQLKKVYIYTPRPITNQYKRIDTINQIKIHYTTQKQASILRHSHYAPDRNQVAFTNRITSPFKIQQPIPVHNPQIPVQTLPTSTNHNNTFHIVYSGKMPIMPHKKQNISTVSLPNTVTKKSSVESLLPTKPEIRFNYVSQSGLVTSQPKTTSHANLSQSKQTFETLNILNNNNQMMNFSKNKTNRSLTSYTSVMREGANGASTSTMTSSDYFASKKSVMHNGVGSVAPVTPANIPSLNTSLPIGQYYSGPSFIKKVPRPMYTSTYKSYKPLYSSTYRLQKTFYSGFDKHVRGSVEQTPGSPIAQVLNAPSIHTSSATRLQNLLNINPSDADLFTKPELLKGLTSFSPRETKNYAVQYYPEKRLNTYSSPADRYELIYKYIEMEPKVLYDQYEANIVNSRSATNFVKPYEYLATYTQTTHIQTAIQMYTPSMPYSYTSSYNTYNIPPLILPVKTVESIQSDRSYEARTYNYEYYDRNAKTEREEPTEIKTPEEVQSKVEYAKVVYYVPEHPPKEESKYAITQARYPEDNEHKYLLSYDMEMNDSKNIKSSIIDKDSLNNSSSLINAMNMTEPPAPAAAYKVAYPLPTITEQTENYVSTPARARPLNKYNSTIAEVSESENSADNEEYLYFFMEEYQGGSRYEGYKKNGMRNGKGKFYYQDGGYYEGQWKDNKMHGFGKLYYNYDKLAYEGYWYLDEFHGHGKVYNDNPVKLEGTFNYLNFDEMGYYWVYYEGSLVTDTKYGFGRLKFSNNELFYGYFRHDRIEGKGRFYRSSGEIVNGLWKDNKLVKVFD